jgi:hypothetical protein
LDEGAAKLDCQVSFIYRINHFKIIAL